MAERKPCKGLNSKCFLTTYLIIVGFLLVLWMNRLPLLQEEKRDIPDDLVSYIESPARPLPDFSLLTNDKLALTQQWFKDKWTFVYFSHTQCLPACQPVFDQVSALQSAFANKDLQYLVVGVNTRNESISVLSEFLVNNKVAMTAATSDSQKQIDDLARSFIALYLITDYQDGSSLVEQENHLLLVDPKGRVYATFKPPFNLQKNNAMFLKLRLFYARSEQE